ncbi:MAG TPA: class I SAM-dependent methyltransferase [Planosporangium sp.]|jgi:predicted O-methyltransferase YrrM|nr:class I SAM-dependent methyltransferase [Planosporangium sp.]
MTSVNLEYVGQLYRKYGSDLAVVRDAQREFLRDNPSVNPQLDDHEAEITYLLLRERRPEVVVEIGTFHGWSTSWILRALGDNGVGRLYSYDIVDHAVRNVPPGLAADRWTFTRGDVKASLHTVPATTEYLFIDAAHSGRFARWYIDNLFPRVPAGIPVSVHDVFHGRRPLPFTEGAVILRWLADSGIRYFTGSAAKAPEVYRQLDEIKRELGIAEPVRTTRDNPMIFFELP